MIRPAKLDRFVSFQRRTEHLDDARRVVEGWTTFQETRAELVENSLAENPQPFGEAETAQRLFRLRYVAGITTADRLLYDGRSFDIRKVVEIGRRRALEILVEAVK